MLRSYLSLMLIAAAAWAGAQDADNASSFGTYRGYSEAKYAGVTVESAYVPTADGERIAIDIYRPAEGPAQEAFPVILQYTPYQRAVVNPVTGEFKDKRGDGVVKLALEHGYIVIWADMRGTGASTGWLLDFFPPIWDDGKTLVDWIAAQPWCDGNVGMMGGSYVGWSQTATAARKPEALKCIVPSVIPLEGFTGEIYPGGIYLQGFMRHWSDKMAPAQRNHFLPDHGLWPSRPALDEDGDGDLHDEVPLDQDGSGTFLDDGFPPQYADGATRSEHAYYHASKTHEKNYDYHSWAQNTPYIDGKSPLGYTISDLGPAAHVQPMRDTGIPIYHLGGWFDGFTRGTFELWASLEATNFSKVIMFPGYHRLTGGGYYDYTGADPKEADSIRKWEHLRFFDRYLKGIENGIDAEPRIHYYVMNGEGWRAADAWPPTDAAERTWYFGAGGTLSPDSGDHGADPYTVDYTHSSTYDEMEGNRWVGISGQTPRVAQDRTAHDAKCLVYETATLEASTEVTGHPLVTLWVSSSEAYGDFFVYLEDVTPDGRAIYVTEGQLRAGYAAMKDNDLIVPQEPRPFDVKPELPWHGYREQDYVDAILADGAVVELTFDLLPTSWVFKEGHRIRISIAGSDYPTFRLHPKLCPTNTPEAAENIVPTVKIHRGGLQASKVVLPVR